MREYLVSSVFERLFEEPQSGLHPVGPFRSDINEQTGNKV
jgi:hypothetical protein